MEVQVVDYTAPDAATGKFPQSLHETGFGVLKRHPSRRNWSNASTRAGLDFFDSDDKAAFAFNLLRRRGRLVLHRHLRDGQGFNARRT